MAFVGYVQLGGNEIVNSGRVAAYAQALAITSINCTECVALPQVLGDSPYTSPDMDDAPWFDPTVVASKDFAGVLGTEIIGLEHPVNSREVIPLAADGAALNPIRRSAREIQVHAVLFARTECALSYGRSWMAAAVRGSSCGLDCVGDDLCYLACCPGCAVVNDEGDCTDAQWRTLYNVGVLEGPTVEQSVRLLGGWMQTVEFTLTAGNPFIYHRPVLVAQGPTTAQVIPGFNNEDAPDCSEATNCVADATETDVCKRLPLPLLPLMPVDPCFPTGPFTAYRAVVSLPVDLTPAWLETVPLLQIRVGPRPLKRFMIRWYTNQAGLDCFEGLENPNPSLRPISPCDACAELHIPIVPANSTLTLDGRIERAWVDCPGGPGLATAEPYIYGSGGMAFQWPAFGCGQAMCIEIVVQQDSVTGTPEATWTVSTVAREDAS
jgi:hypothetical protein